MLQRELWVNLTHDTKVKHGSVVILSFICTNPPEDRIIIVEKQIADKIDRSRAAPCHAQRLLGNSAQKQGALDPVSSLWDVVWVSRQRAVDDNRLGSVPNNRTQYDGDTNSKTHHAAQHW